MAKTLHTDVHFGPDIPEIHHVDASQPFHWLARGWYDFTHAPVTSLLYGAFFALMGWGLYAVSEGPPHFVLTWVAAFFLAGPFLASGLYTLAHRMEHNHPATLYHAVTAWHRSGLQMAIYVALIAFMMLFWVRFTWLMVGLAFDSGVAIDMGAFASKLTTLGPGFEYLGMYAVLGILFAALVFSISVVALPMLQDRRVDIVTAMITSLVAVRTNPGAMAVWAGLIVALTVIGFATYMIGLILVLPLLGYATWHAYRDIVPRHHE